MAYKRVLLPVGLDKNGNPIAKQIGGKSEAERFMRGLQAAIASGRIRELLPPEYFQSSEPLKTEENTKQLHPFTAYAHMFYERYKRHLRRSTNVTQRSWLKQQCRFFGDEPVEDITVSRVQDYVNSLQGNTTETINKKLTFLREIHASAYEDDLIAKNPADSRRINLGGKDGTGIKALSRETVKELIKKSRLLTICMSNSIWQSCSMRECAEKKCWGCVGKTSTSIPAFCASKGQSPRDFENYSCIKLKVCMQWSIIIRKEVELLYALLSV